MFIITLSLTEKKSEAPAYMALHNEWIAQGFEDGVFILVGSLQPQSGGAILAISESLSAIERRVAADPFVREGIVTPKIQEVVPTRTDQRLSFLNDAAT